MPTLLSSAATSRASSVLTAKLDRVLRILRLSSGSRRYSGAMSQRRSTQEKKEDSYRHEWRARSRLEQSALRIGRPRRKAGISRANRRIARLRLADLSDEGVDVVIPEHSPWRRWHVPVRLDRWVESRIESRRNYAGWNYFKEPYESERHQLRFTAFLTALVAIRGDEARHLAPIWQDRLADPFRGRPWLESFFRDQPALRGTLDSWIARWGMDVSDPPRRGETTT